MARRASSSIHPLWIGVLLLLLVAAIAGGYFLFGRVNDPYRTISALDVGVYLENSNSLRGNTYKVTGIVLNSLAWSATAGRLFSVEVGAGSNTDVLPVLIPVQFNHVNVQKGQKFIFQIEVDEKGILKARDLQKV
jgi:hypothetical protein